MLNLAQKRCRLQIVICEISLAEGLQTKYNYHFTTRAQFSQPIPRHLNRAQFSDWLSSIQYTIPKESRIVRRHYTVKGDIRPNFTELVFFSLRAIRVSANHWQFVDITPACSTSSRKASTAASAKLYGVPWVQQLSKEMVPPVVVSAWREREQPGEREALSPLQQSEQIQTSGRYSSILALTLSLTLFRMLVDILLPAHVPLTLFMYPLSYKFILVNFRTEGITTCTWPPPSGRYPRLMILICSSLSMPQCVFRQGSSWFWMLSIELSSGWLVRPQRCTFRAVLPVIAIRRRYSRQQEMQRSSPQSKWSSTPSLLVTMPEYSLRMLPPLATMTLQPLLMAAMSLRKWDSSGSSPGGWLCRLMSSSSKFCSATSAHRIWCLKTWDSFLTSINNKPSNIQYRQV